MCPLRLAVLTYDVGLARALPHVASVGITQDSMTVPSPQEALGARGCEFSGITDEGAWCWKNDVSTDKSRKAKREKLVEVEG